MTFAGNQNGIRFLVAELISAKIWFSTRPNDREGLSQTGYTAKPDIRYVFVKERTFRKVSLSVCRPGIVRGTYLVRWVWTVWGNEKRTLDDSRTHALLNKTQKRVSKTRLSNAGLVYNVRVLLRGLRDGHNPRAGRAENLTRGFPCILGVRDGRPAGIGGRGVRRFKTSSARRRRQRIIASRVVVTDYLLERYAKGGFLGNYGPKTHASGEFSARSQPVGGAL